MLTLRRAGERHHVRRRRQELWRTFDPQDRADPLAGGFGALEALDESRLPPGVSAAAHPRQEAEIITYVLHGALAQEDSTGRSGVLHSGEFQRMTTGRQVHHTERNASPIDWAHVFRLSLRPASAERERGQEQKLFTVAERRGELCLVASPDGQRGSLRMQQDARLYSAVLDAGEHLVHELASGRRTWLHLVTGEVTLDDLVLVAGDGAGATDERAVSVTARAQSELMLLDLGPAPAWLAEAR